MVKTLLTFISISVLSIYAQDKAFIKTENNKITIGNNSIERIIDVSADKAFTQQILNKVSGTTYNVNSDEFKMEVIYSGWGTPYSKHQNGESPVYLTSKDFHYKGYETGDLNSTGKKLVLKYDFNYIMSAFEVNVIYTVFPGDLFMRKWIEISDTIYQTQFLDKLFIESLSFSEADLSHGQFGQPVFNKDIFLGVEYPTAENTLDSGKVAVGYLVGKKIDKSIYQSHTAIIGVAPSPVKLEQTFMDYVDQIKVKGTRQFLLYNTWYDLRLPFMVQTPENILNEKNVLNRIDSFKKRLSNTDIELNAFIIDLGWDNLTAKWEIDPTRFPHGFSGIESKLNSMHTSLGLWASPFGGYEERLERIKWAKKNGYETSGEFLCFAGTKDKNALMNSMINYTKKYNIGYFKWDGLSVGCNEINHGHLPGAYSHEAIVSNFIEMIDTVRKINPNIFINITIGTWLSPWWLKYADCVWMQGEDYGYADNVPCINDRDKAITYKDGVLWDDLRSQQLLFPTSSIMTHGIIKGSLNLLGGKNETLDSFTNEVMMYFGRGVMMWELYLTPDLVSDKEWKSITSTINWAKANKTVLEKTKMILGNPLKQEPYGYIHLTKEKGILLLRNPNVNGHDVKITLSPDLGDIDPSAKYFVKIIYPYKMILADPVTINKDMTIHLDGYEILSAELIPSQSIDQNLPLGIKYSTENNNLTVYDKAGSKRKIETIKKDEIAEINFTGTDDKINIEKNHSDINDNNEFRAACKINIPPSYKSARIGYLLEGENIAQGISSPSLTIMVNGVEKKATVKQENGKWFWIFADLDSKENDISCKISLDNKDKWKCSTWVFADEELSGKTIKSELSDDKAILPERPYEANINKIIIPIN